MFMSWLTGFITLFFTLLLSINISANANVVAKESNAQTFSQEHVQEPAVIVGAEQLPQYLSLLKGKRVGLVVNQTSRIFNEHLVDHLLTEKINVQAIFSPEHGFRGDKDAGEKFDSSIDSKTGINLISLYGQNRRPSKENIENIDVIVFDIQDVGVRFYTYISTMHYMMAAARDAGIKFIVLDRPNPNGAYVDGPVLEPKYNSFVGMHPIPLLHGMTVGELAQMIKGEGWLNDSRTVEQLESKVNHQVDLTVIRVKNYNRAATYHLPIKPSPNLPNPRSIALYPSLGFFEATPVSIGRGTPFPFQVIGHDNIKIGQFHFKPEPILGAASKPKLMGKNLVGEDLRLTTIGGLHLKYLIRWQKAFADKNLPFFTSPEFMDKLSGTDKLRKLIVAGESEANIRESWQADLAIFIDKRKPYLLYE